MVAAGRGQDHRRARWSVGWASRARLPSRSVPTVLLATDADWIFDEVDAALGDADTTVYRVRAGIDVLGAIDEVAPDLVVLDQQIGNMGGMATCMAIRNAEGIDRIPITAVLMLLDRGHDAFLARRHDADGYLVKPVDAFRLRRAATTLLAGESWFEEIDPVSSQPADLTLRG
nr:response regulator [Rhabdothermincola salaria]